MNVLSLFDGMSCGQLALDRLGVPVDNYYASEIDKHAITIAFLNYPNTEHLGDVTKWREWDIDWKSIGLLLGGSPCQGFSFAGKQLNFDDPRSKLFFVYVDILNHIKSVNPHVIFLLENVHMKKEYEAVITEHMGVEPIKINSALVSAQNRKRIYWTNMPAKAQPEDKGILLKDIVHEYSLVDRDKSNCLTANFAKHTERDYRLKSRGQIALDIIPNFNTNPSGKGMNGNVRDVNNPKSTCLTTNKGEGAKIAVPTKVYKLNLSIPEATKKGYVEVEVGDGVDTTFLNSKTRRGRLMKEKSNCLTAANYDYGILEELKQYIVPFDKTLQILDKEIEKGKVGFFRKDSQGNRVYFIHDKAVTLTCNAGGRAGKMGMYLFGCITSDRVNKRQKGQRFSEGKKFYTLTAQDQHGVLIEGYIRKLTPIECERLQTVPDNYTQGVSNSQRYRMLGNGWTIDVICHLLDGIDLM